MKNVNYDYYFQYLKRFNFMIKDEIRLVKLQNDRYFNFPTEFDIKNNISKEKVYTYLQDAISKLGNSDIERKKFISKYAPDKTIKPDFKRIEAYVKRNKRKINTCFDITSKWDVYFVISEFFCSVKWQVPENQKNNNRIYKIVEKYCEIY